MTTIDTLVSEYEKLISKRTKKTTQTFIDDFKSVVTTYLKKSKATTKTGKTVGKRDDSDKKFNTWARIWVSTRYGGKTRFPEDYARIKTEAEESGHKLTSFQILSVLRTELEAEDDRQRWTEWVEWVQEENSDAPTDPPTDRQAKKEVKKKPVPKKTTGPKKTDDEVEEDEPVKPAKPLAKVVTKAPATKAPAVEDEDVDLSR